MKLLSFEAPGPLKKKRPRVVPKGSYWIKGRKGHFIADRGANIGGPRIVRWEYEGGKIVLFNPSPANPLNYRLQRDDKSVDVLADIGQLPGIKREVYDRTFNARPIHSGESDTFDLTLRFGNSDTDPVSLASEALQYFREKKYPHMLKWPDRRPIAATFVSGTQNHREGNPNGYILAPNGWSIHDENAMETFRKSVIENAEQYADRLVQRGYQGVVVWNISGEQYESAKYYGEPRLMEHIAPEMDQATDDYFRILREHGLRVGLTIRPVIHKPVDKEGQIVSWDDMHKLKNVNHGARLFESDVETYLNPREAYSGLARLHYKIQYAKERWGATMFYIDYPAIWRPKAPNNWEHPPISPAVYRKLKELHPEVLLMPEDGILASWSAAAPYGEVPQYSGMTPEPVRQVYPDAFSVRVINKSAITGHKNADKFARGLRRGDVPMADNQWKLDETLQYLRPIQSDTPYVASVGKNSIRLSGPGFNQEISSTEALRKTLAGVLSANASVPQRRVRIKFDAEVTPGRVREVVDAIGNGNGIVTWSEPASGTQSED